MLAKLESRRYTLRRATEKLDGFHPLKKKQDDCWRVRLKSQKQSKDHWSQGRDVGPNSKDTKAKRRREEHRKPKELGDHPKRAQRKIQKAGIPMGQE